MRSDSESGSAPARCAVGYTVRASPRYPATLERREVQVGSPRGRRPKGPDDNRRRNPNPGLHRRPPPGLDGLGRPRNEPLAGPMSGRKRSPYRGMCYPDTWRLTACQRGGGAVGDRLAAWWCRAAARRPRRAACPLRRGSLGRGGSRDRPGWDRRPPAPRPIRPCGQCRSTPAAWSGLEQQWNGQWR